MANLISQVRVHRQYLAMSEHDRDAWDLAWLDYATEGSVVYLEDYLSGDYDAVGSNRRFELGE